MMMSRIVTTIFCMSCNYIIYFGDLLVRSWGEKFWLFQHCSRWHPQRGSTQSTGKFWITLSRRAKQAQCSLADTSTQPQAVTQAWIIGQSVLRSVSDPDSWCVKCCRSFTPTLRRMERNGPYAVRKDRGVKGNRHGECHDVNVQFVLHINDGWNAELDTQAAPECCDMENALCYKSSGQETGLNIKESTLIFFLAPLYIHPLLYVLWVPPAERTSTQLIPINYTLYIK